MPNVAEDFAACLATVSRPSQFCVSGIQQMLAPGLSVEGVGPIALPLLPVQAEQLIAAAERAPYGRGPDTLTDITVRRTWQIGAERIRIAGKHWPETLKAIVARVAEGLGLTDPIVPELYKMLVYDQGSFFVPHRDTEKAPGMFATLVLALPSVSEGGELIVRHKDRAAQFDLQASDPSEIAFAAFYADCVHEVRTVTAGCRVVLVYNLVRHGPGRLPEPPDYGAEQDAIAAVLRGWADTEPRKLIYTLEHAYTPAELGFHALKGADAAIAEVVAGAARQADCDVHLALLSIHEDGTATPKYNSSGRYDDDDDDEDFEADEVNEREAILSNWRRPDGDPSPLAKVPVDEAEFSPPISFDEIEPDEEHFQEATGNAGASYERTYSRTALVLWPRDGLIGVIAEGGLEATLPFLEDLDERFRATADPAIRRQAGALTARMMSDWQMDRWYSQRNQEPTAAARFLDALRSLGDASGLDGFLAKLATRAGLDRGDGASIALALQALPNDRASALVDGLVRGAVHKSLGACAHLLACVSRHAPAVAAGGARGLIAALPGDPQRGPARPAWEPRSLPSPAVIVDLFTALGRIDPTLAAVTVDHVLDWPGTYDFDDVLRPAAHILLDTPETSGQPTTQRLRQACLAHLDARIALPLAPPSDWKRGDKLSCGCKDCQALGGFLRDATQPVWVFAAAEPRRRHVESTIRESRCDVDHATERRGSPHRLVCTKNQASYERRVVQRSGDLKQRDLLNQPSGR